LCGQALLENASRNQATVVAEEFPVGDAQKVAAAGQITTEPGERGFVHPCGKRGWASGYQWAMRDYTGTARDVARIVCIVMDSIAVMAQRSIAKLLLRLRAPFA